MSDNRANWGILSSVASISPLLGPTTTFFAPGVGGTFTVTASAVADTTKTTSTDIFVPPIGGGGGGGGGGKFITDNVDPSSNPIVERSLVADESTESSATARSFVRPNKRSKPKPPPKPRDT